jgi:hypothetical protein
MVAERRKKTRAMDERRPKLEKRDFLVMVAVDLWLGELWAEGWGPRGAAAESAFAWLALRGWKGFGVRIITNG